MNLKEARIKLGVPSKYIESPGILPKNTNVMLHLGDGKVDGNAKYIRAGRTEGLHHVLGSTGELHTGVPTENIGHNGKWLRDKKND